MNRITLFLALVLLVATSAFAQQEPFVVSHLFLKVNHAYTLIGDVEAETDGRAYIWLDDYEVKIYYSNISVQELKFEGEVRVGDMEGLKFWLQKVRNTLTDEVLDFTIFTQDKRPNHRFIILEYADGFKKTLDCEVISAKHY